MGVCCFSFKDSPHSVKKILEPILWAFFGGFFFRIEKFFREFFFGSNIFSGRFFFKIIFVLEKKVNIFFKGGGYRVHFPLEYICIYLGGQTFSRDHGGPSAVKRKATSSR